MRIIANKWKLGDEAILNRPGTWLHLERVKLVGKEPDTEWSDGQWLVQSVNDSVRGYVPWSSLKRPMEG